MDIFDRIWDRGQQVFEKWADLEIREVELEIQKDLAVQQLQMQALQAPKASGFLPGQTQGGGGISVATILLIAAVGVGGYFLIKKA